MHLIEDRNEDSRGHHAQSPSSSPPPSSSSSSQQQQQQVGSRSGNSIRSTGGGRPWDQYDTEDSGVDSVSSVVGLEAENGNCAAVKSGGNGVVGDNVEYADVIVHRVSSDSGGQQKSFLHSIYGGVQQQQQRHQQQKQQVESNSPSKNPIRKNLQKIISKYSGSNSSLEKLESTSNNGKSSKHSDVQQKQLLQQQRSVETAKNSFLHSLLDDESGEPPPDASNADNTDAQVGSELSPSSSWTPTPTLALDLLPELVQLLDAVQMKNGTVELVGRDGTRASLKVTLTGPVANKASTSLAVISSPDKLRRKTSFNRIHRNSKRSSQRRSNKPLAVTVLAPTASSTDAGTTNVRRRPSGKRSTQPASPSAFTLSLALPTTAASSSSSSTATGGTNGTKVATLASKFNSLISEGRGSSRTGISGQKGSVVTVVATSGRRSSPDKSHHHSASLSPSRRSSAQTKSMSQSQRVSAPQSPPPPPPANKSVKTRSTVKRNPSSSVKPSVDTIPEGSADSYSIPEGEIEPVVAAEEHPVPPRRRKSGHYAQPAVLNNSNNSQGVYGTVKSIVKQAIRKFEKLEVSPSKTNEKGEDDNYEESYGYQQTALTSYETVNSTSLLSSSIPDGIAPNSSFLWRDQRSMQNLIYEATAFGERIGASSASSKPKSASATGSSSCLPNGNEDATEATYYDTFGCSSPGPNTYDTLQHLRDRVRSNNDVGGAGSNTNKSSPSPSTNGYDEIGQPPAASGATTTPSSSSRPDAGRRNDDMSVKYDDIMKVGSCSLYGGATYDELSFLHQRGSYEQLQSTVGGSVWSVSGGDGGYIHPGSSSTCSSNGTLPGYERILPITSTLPDATAACGEDEDGSTLRYEECGDVIVSCPNGAAMQSSSKTKSSSAVVREDQMDSISYLYDDIRSGGLGTRPISKEAFYNGSNHSYEPIYAHLGDGSDNKGHRRRRPMSSGSSSASSVTLSGSCGSEDGSGVHEVSSYRLTQLGGVNLPVPGSPAPSSEAGTASLASATRTTTERRSETSDEWIDVSDGDGNGDEPAWTVTRIRQRHEPVNASFARRGHRASSRRKASIPKSTRGQTWSQTMRNLVRTGFTKAATLSKRTGRTAQQTLNDITGGGKQKATKTSSTTQSAAVPTDPSASVPAAYEPVYQLRKVPARRHPSAETEASGTGSSQTWEDCGESDADDETNHHYEALYEVINPACMMQASASAASTTSTSTSIRLDHQDDSFDDSFDSDDAFEEVVVRGLDATSDTSRDRPGSRSGSERSKESKENPYGIARFADLAGAQMRRLRRNWSTTKTDIGKSITRIKKKSTASVADLSEVFRPVSTVIAGSNGRTNGQQQEKQQQQPQVVEEEEELQGSNNSIEDESPPLPRPPTHGRNGKKASTWALRQIKRRMTISPLSGTSKKDASTFYLTLTIEKPGSVPNSSGKGSSVSDTSSPEPSQSTPSPPPPLISPASAPVLGSCNNKLAPMRPKRTSSISAIPPGQGHYQATVRPKTAPPAPPVKTASSPSSVAQSTPNVAAASSALNGSTSSSSANKKPLSRLTTAYSESRLAVEKSQLIDEYQTQYCDIAIRPSERRSVPGTAATSESDLMGTPYSRLSLASSVSRLSSENYMGLNDLASTPANGDQRRSSARLSPGAVNEEGRSYMDLQPPLESEELYISSHFADEPLYQFYTAAIIERASHNQGEGSEEDDYEVIGENRRKEEQQLQFNLQQQLKQQQQRKLAQQEEEESNAVNKLPTAMELVAPVSGRRTLWCELPQVINSGLLEKISPQQRKLQEAMFEMITSEASYLRSLNVLTTHFIQSREFSGGDLPSPSSPGGSPVDAVTPVLSRLERHTLFSDILPVRECSEALLTDLERRWQESVYIREICDILLDHASKHFEVYIKYCTNQLYQERMLRDLKDNKPQFVEVLRRLESSPVCQSLAMHSFLMLPMQRITRLPLLVDAIFHRLESGTPEYERCRMTLATLNKIVQECNEGARKAERIHEMLVVSNQLDFADVKAISIMSASRWLVKKGEMQRLMWRDIEARLTFGRKIHKQTVYVFLFTDLLVITKKKGDDAFTVLDYCPRNMVQVDENVRAETTKAIGKPGSELGKNLILLTMLQNHENKTVEMVLSCSSESDRTRWLEAVTPRTSDNPEEKIYEEWDCPQVQTIHPYVATQPDELSLEVADVVNVLRKMADGWYQGERLRDDERGWFPGNYTVEIASAHVRARNLRQRYRLLALSGSFIEEQARKDKEENKRKSKKLSLTNE